MAVGFWDMSRLKGKMVLSVVYRPATAATAATAATMFNSRYMRESHDGFRWVHEACLNGFRFADLLLVVGSGFRSCVGPVEGLSPLLGTPKYYVVPQGSILPAV